MNQQPPPDKDQVKHWLSGYLEEEEAHQLYYHIQQQFPQVNDYTDVEGVYGLLRDCIYVHRGEPVRVMLEEVPKKGLKARLYRTAGELLNSSQLKRQGMRMSPLGKGNNPPNEALKMVGIGVQSYHHAMPPFYLQSIVYCAYDALEDRLYMQWGQINRRVDRWRS